MGKHFPPLYGEGIKFWSDELAKAVSNNSTEAIQECLRRLSLFIKKDESKD